MVTHTDRILNAISIGNIFKEYYEDLGTDSQYFIDDFFLTDKEYKLLSWEDAVKKYNGKVFLDYKMDDWNLWFFYSEKNGFIF